MLFILIAVDAKQGDAQGIKEDLAMHLEKFGDSRVIDIREDLPEQLMMEVGV